MTGASTLGRQVDVVGSVDIDTPDGRLVIEGAGETVSVSAADAGTFRSLTGPLLRLDRSARRRHIAQLNRGLAAAGLELTFHIDRREVARLGGGLGPGLAALGLAMPGLRVRWMRAMRAFLVSR